jgi:hypothetical protein
VLGITIIAPLKDWASSILECHLLSKRAQSDYMSFPEARSRCIYECCNEGIDQNHARFSEQLLTASMEAQKQAIEFHPD